MPEDVLWLLDPLLVWRGGAVVDPDEAVAGVGPAVAS